MHDAAVVAGLVKSQAVFGLEHQAAQSMVDRERARRGETDDPSTHDRDVERAHAGRIPRIPAPAQRSQCSAPLPRRPNLLQ